MSTTLIIEEIHVGDIGTVIEITMKNGAKIVDISDATTKDIKLKKPSGTVLTKPGVFASGEDGTNGKMRYVTINSDVDESGVWKVQAHTIHPSGEWHSNINDMSVFDNIS